MTMGIGRGSSSMSWSRSMGIVASIGCEDRSTGKNQEPGEGEQRCG
jgi:hypothetical protein